MQIPPESPCISFITRKTRLSVCISVLSGCYVMLFMQQGVEIKVIIIADTKVSSFVTPLHDNGG